MNFYVPGHESSAVVSRHEVPHHLSKYKIPFSKTTYTEFDQGNILSQELKGDGFSFWLHHFFIYEHVCVHPYTTRPRITLHYMRQGHVECELLSLGRVSIHEGFYHLFCIPTGLKHKAFLTPGHFCSFHLDLSRELLHRIHLREDARKAIADYFDNPNASGKQLFQGCIDPLVKAAIHRVQHCSIRDELSFKLFLQQKLHKLLLLFAEDLLATSGPISLRAINAVTFDLVSSYIRTHLDQDLTIPSLCSCFHLSKSSLYRMFMEAEGVYPRQYVHRCRMEAAMKLLRHTHMSIQEIAYETGYRHTSSFVRAFILCYHQTPKDYRCNK